MREVRLLGFASDERRRDHFEGYEEGYEDGYKYGFERGYEKAMRERNVWINDEPVSPRMKSRSPRTKPKRKLSAWNKFVKANSKKKKYIYQSGKKKGKLNLKKMGVDFRKKKRR